MNFTYQESLNNTQSHQNFAGSKVGFFKLSAEGAEALVRFNIASVDDLYFATVHKPIFGKRFEGLANPFASINCLNDYGVYGSNKCPLCAAAGAENAVADKVKKVLFVPMLVCYKDMTTGSWGEAQAVVWERPAGFSKELAAIMQDYGDLRNLAVKITRSGSGKDTRYTMLPANPMLANIANTQLKPDFSAFNNFEYSKHCYWEKTAEELTIFVETGRFPEVPKPVIATAVNTPVTPTPIPTAPAKPSPAPIPAPEVATPSVAPAQPTPTLTATSNSFGTFNNNLGNFVPKF